MAAGDHPSAADATALPPAVTAHVVQFPVALSSFAGVTVEQAASDPATMYVQVRPAISTLSVHCASGRGQPVHRPQRANIYPGARWHARSVPCCAPTRVATATSSSDLVFVRVAHRVLPVKLVVKRLVHSSKTICMPLQCMHAGEVSRPSRSAVRHHQRSQGAACRGSHGCHCDVQRWNDSGCV